MTTTPDLAEDVDVLIVAADPGVGDAARGLLDQSLLPPVIDLLVMSPAEERELEWVVRQSAIEIFPVSRFDICAAPPTAVIDG